MSGGVECDGVRNPMWFPTRSISTESLVIGAIESAFWEMDARIGEEKKVVILFNWLNRQFVLTR